MEPTFEALSDPDSYACRVGKGTLAAIRRAQVLARNSSWYAKLDVHHCFETADVERLIGRLRGAFTDAPLLAVVERVLRAGVDASGRGLPIGNLTSQHFANFMLGVLDARAREAGACGYVRYMDDILVFGASKTHVTDIAEALADTMVRDLGQREKVSARRIAPTSTGVPCLGFRVWPHLVRFDGPRTATGTTPATATTTWAYASRARLSAPRGNARRLAVTAARPEHRIRPTSRACAHTPFLSGRAEDQAPGHTFGGRFATVSRHTPARGIRRPAAGGPRACNARAGASA